MFAVINAQLILGNALLSIDSGSFDNFIICGQINGKTSRNLSTPKVPRVLVRECTAPKIYSRTFYFIPVGGILSQAFQQDAELDPRRIEDPPGCTLTKNLRFYFASHAGSLR